MRIRDAYIVKVDFDDDFHSNINGIYVFAGKDKSKEVREFISHILVLIYKEHSLYEDLPLYLGWDRKRMKDMIENDKGIDKIIDFGGAIGDGWDITIDQTNDTLYWGGGK